MDPLAPILISAKKTSASKAASVKNIVLVHGAFVDGSGWRQVCEILMHDGYT